MLDDRFEACCLEALLGGLHGFLVGVWADLYAIIFVALRRLDEGGKFLSAQIVGDGHGVGLGAQGDDLQ